MKKTYKSPKSRVINIDSEELICQSPQFANGNATMDGGDNDYEGQGLSKMLNIVNMGDDEAMTWE